MIVVTVIHLMMHQVEFPFVHNQKENCHNDCIPFNLKVIRNIVLRVQALISWTWFGSELLCQTFDDVLLPRKYQIMIRRLF